MCGIYIIRCNGSNKVYVGQTSNFRRRKQTHLRELADNKHINKHLQRAFVKYGADSFIWEFLECDKEHLNEMEQWCIDQHKGALFNNKLIVAGNYSGIKMPESHKRGGEKRKGDNNGSKRADVRLHQSLIRRTFTDEQCREIFEKYSQGVGQVALAEMYGCTRQPIRNAIKYAGGSAPELGIWQRRTRIGARSNHTRIFDTVPQTF